MKPGLQRGLLYCLLLVMLAACSSDDEPGSSGQQYYFLEALQQVETGGRQLQTADLSQQDLLQALAMLDQGLKLAFEVKRDFLDQLDLRLGKNFQRYFIKGVENYRLGIEAGDAAQQREGLQLLTQWSEFWNLERDAILARLKPG
jgi:hypothetical protein